MELGLSRNHIATKLNVTGELIRKYETGEVKLWRHPDRINEIAKILGVSPDYFTKDIIQEESNVYKARSISLYEGVTASGEFMAEKSQGLFADFEALIDASRDYIAVRVTGNSLAPRLKHSDYMLIAESKMPPLQSIVAIQFKDGRIGIRQCVESEAPHPYKLRSYFDTSDVISTFNEIKVLGYAVAILKHYTAGEANLEWQFGRALPS